MSVEVNFWTDDDIADTPDRELLEAMARSAFRADRNTAQILEIMEKIAGAVNQMSNSPMLVSLFGGAIPKI